MEEALRLLHARSTGTLSTSGINPEDVAWFLEYAVEPFYLLQQVHPHLNASTLPPPTNPFRVARSADGVGYFGKRDQTCLNGDGNNNNNNNNGTSSKKPPIGAIVGGVVGGIAVLAILAFVICFFCIRKRKKKTVVPVTNSQMGQAQVPQVYNNPNPTMPMPNPNTQPYPYPINQPILSHASSSWSGNEPLIGGMNNQSNPGSIGSGQNYMNMGAASSTVMNPNNNQQGGYYNYVPPPPVEGNAAAGVASDRSNYSVTPAPTFQTTAASSSHPSQTPSPPPTSNYAVWAIPSEGSNSPPPPSATDPPRSEKAQFLARDEKAQFRPASTISSTRIQSPAPPYQPHMMGNP
ncbi:hypothetical protein CPB86DRAFT_781408 [Serendipita vermifera]|nr:hypothetical protein CPB86DRAFT_781408 [Serendipita vermifera]